MKCDSTMVWIIRLVYFALVLLKFCQASTYISPCRVDDEKCLTSTAQLLYPKISSADPLIGTESLDPVWIEKVDGTLTFLKFRLENVTIFGYKDCKIKHLSIDTKQSHLKINLVCPEVKMVGNYNMNGRLIVLPVEGNGNCSLVIHSYDINIETEYKVLKTDDGKEYMSIQNFNVDAKTDKGAIFYFDNLFNGRKDLADTVLKFANDNSKEVLHEFQKPLLSVHFKKIIKNVNKFLKTTPMEHLFIQ